MLNREWDANYDEFRLVEHKKELDGGWLMHLVRLVDDKNDKNDKPNPQDDCGFYLPPESPVQPAVGMTVRLYNATSEPGRVRGLIIDGQEVYYRDEDADREFARREAAEHEAALRASYDQLQGELALQIAGLPEVLRRRIDRLRANAPETFWRHEAHEVAVLEAALLIREHTTRALQKAVDEITTSGLAGAEVLNEKSLGQVYRSFSRLPREIQRRFIPGIPDVLTNKDVELATAFAHALAQGWDDQVIAYHAVGCAADGDSCAECGCFDAETLARLNEAAAQEGERKEMEGWVEGEEAAEDGPCDGNCASCTRHEKEDAAEAFRKIADLAQRPNSPAWWNADFGQSA